MSSGPNRKRPPARKPSQNSSGIPVRKPGVLKSEAPSTTPSKLLEILTDATRVSSGALKDTQLFIQELGIDASRNFAMKALNATSTALTQIHKSGWMRGSNSRIYTEESVQIVVDIANVALSALRSRQVDISSEKAALSIFGRLLMLKMFDRAFSMARDMKHNLEMLLPVEGSPTARPVSSSSSYMEIQLASNPTSDLATLIVKYLSYTFQLSLHLVLDENRKVMSEFLHKNAETTSRGDLLSWLRSPIGTSIAEQLLPACTAMLKSVEISVGNLPPLQATQVRIYSVQCVLAVASTDETRWIWRHLRNVISSFNRAARKLETQATEVIYTSVRTCIDIAKARVPMHEFEKDLGFMQLKDLCPFLDAEVSKTSAEHDLYDSSIQDIVAAVDSLSKSMPDSDIRQELQSICKGWKTTLITSKETKPTDQVFRVLERFRRKFVKRRGGIDVTKANQMLLVTYTTIYMLAEAPSSLSSHILSGIVEIRIDLSKATLDKANPGTFEESYQHLEAASSLISNTIGTDECRIYIDDLLRCISGASWNQGSTLYQANRWDHSIPFIAHGVSIDKILISRFQKIRADGQEDGWFQFFSQMPKRISMLGGCYMRLGDNKKASDTYIMALECWLTVNQRDLEQRCPALSSSQIFTTLLGQHICGIIEKMTTIGAFNLRLGPELSLVGAGEHLSLSTPIRGAIVEYQLQMLVRGSRKERLDRIVSHLFDTVTQLYLDEHPIRLARLLLIWLEYAYSGTYGSEEIQKRLKIIDNSLNGDPRMDMNLANLRQQYRLLWHCWRCKFAHAACDDRTLEQHASAAFEIIQECTRQHAKLPQNEDPITQARIQLPDTLDDPDSFWGTLERTWKLFGSIGLAETKFRILDVICKLLQSRGCDEEKSYYLNASTELAHQCCIFELYERSKYLYEKCEDTMRAYSAAETDRSVFLLRHAYLMISLGDQNRGKELYTEAQAIISNADWSLTESSDPLSKLRLRIKRSQLTALACLTYARIKLEDAQLSDAFQGYMQALRISTSVIEVARGALTAGFASKERNPFDMNDLAEDLPDTDYSLKETQGTRHGFHKTAQMNGWNWELADYLLDTQVATARHHILKGTYREAEYFAQEAFYLAEAIFAPARSLMVKSLQLEISLLLRSSFKPPLYFPSLQIHSQDEPFAGQPYVFLLLAFYHERNGEIVAAKNYLDRGFASLAVVDTRLSQIVLHENVSYENPIESAQISLKAALLHRYAFVLAGESQEQLLDDLDQLDDIGTAMITRNLLVCKLALGQATNIFSSHPDLQMIANSVFKLPSHPQRPKKSWNSAEGQLVEVLMELEEHSREATKSTFLRGAVHQFHEASMTLVFALMSQLILGIGDEGHHLAVHLLDTSAALALRRELLDCIISRRETKGASQDLQWPSLLKCGTPSASRTSFSFQLDTKPKRQDIGVEFWAGVEQRLRASSIDVDISRNQLPATWTVVTICYDEDRDALLVGRNRKDRSDLYRLPLKRSTRGEHRREPETLSLVSVVKELDEIITSSVRNGKKAAETAGKGRNAKARWWAERNELDERLKTLVENIEYCWFGGFKTIFSKGSNLTSESLKVVQNGIEALFDEVIGTRGRKSQQRHIDPSIVECLACLAHDCKDEEIEDIAYYILESHQIMGYRLTKGQDMSTIVERLRNILNGRVKQDTPVSSDEHIFLVLDKELQGLPIESMPVLRGRAVSRIPSFSFLVDRLELARIVRNRRGGAGSKRVDGDALPLDPSNVFYLLNPEGDLKRTEETFTPWLRQMSKVGWKGIIGRRPNVFEVQQALESADLFIYFGHGGAEQYIRGSKVRSLERCASTMLWGCSSGHMAYAGDFHRSGTPYNYLLAGCPLLVANLWDVTDRDIDKFAQSVFSMLRLDADTIGTGSSAPGEMSVVDAVARSREVCKLRYLTGSAPVVYGIPFYL